MYLTVSSAAPVKIPAWTPAQLPLITTTKSKLAGLLLFREANDNHILGATHFYTAPNTHYLSIFYSTLHLGGGGVEGSNTVLECRSNDFSSIYWQFLVLIFTVAHRVEFVYVYAY